MSQSIKIGAYQTPEFIGDTDAALADLIQSARKAEAIGVDLLLFPECYLQGYIVTPEHLRTYALDLHSQAFAQILARLRPIKPTLVFGLIEQCAGQYFNTAVVVLGGQIVGTYRKVNLLPGEFLFTPGSEYPVFELNGLTYGINICYDAQYPAAAKALAAQGARVILLPAQNMMRRENAEKWKHEHDRLRQERVKETGCWLISADVTGTRAADRIAYGTTAAISPQGDIVAQVPLGVPGMITADIPV